MLTVGSLFSGIGGLDLGFERAGFVVKWQVEIDPFCQRVLAKHWPEVKRYGDIRECGAHNLERVDVLVGGFPCQPVSLAGRGRAQADRRWLWPEFARLVGELRPRYVVVENTPGLLHRGFGDVLGELAALRYDAEWQSLPAVAFGAPHIRDRVFIVAYALSQPGLGGHCFRGKFDKTWRETSSGQFGRMDGTEASAEAITRLCRSDDGLPISLDGDRQRLKALGNAVVPQVAEYVARCVMEHAKRGGE